MKVERYNDWNIRSRVAKAGGGGCAWASKQPLSADSPLHEDAQEVWFELDDTPEKAVEKLKKELDEVDEKSASIFLKLVR